MNIYTPSIETIKAIIERHRDALELPRRIDGIEVALIGQGEANLNLLVTVDQSRAFNLRIGQRPDESDRTLQNEWDMLQLVPAGIGPRPFAIDLSRKDIAQPYILLGYLDGALQSEWGDRELQLHAETLARLHQRRFERHGSVRELSTDAFDFSHRFEVAIQYWQTNHPYLFEIPIIGRLLPSIRQFISDNNQLFTELRQFSVVHGDAHPLNILFNNDRVAYIDWEWASIGDPAQDVAMVGWDIATAWQFELTGERLERFLQTYLAHHPDPTLQQRRDLWMVYTMFLDQMYHRTQLANDPTGRQAYTVQRIETYLIRRFL